MVKAKGLAPDLDEPQDWQAERRFKPEKAVKWLSPGELMRSGVAAGLATSFGQFFDRREAIAAAVPDEVKDEFDESSVRWFDYVADVGDGFDATYAVASAIAQARLSGPDYDTERGQVLVMGGDEIYPVPAVGLGNETNYHDRTVGPYEAALQSDESREHHLYVLPGNHDWYDGLAGFRKQFLSGRWVGGWKTRQHNTYFAVQLAEGWWLWGIDIALDGPLDQAQVDYFRRVGELVGDDDAIVLCTAKPSWYRTFIPDEPKRGQPELGTDGARAEDPYELLRWFVRATLDQPEQVRMMITGDKHHYARFTECDADGVVKGYPRMKVTAGGGGAYLSLTSDLPREITVREADDTGTATTHYRTARRKADDGGADTVWPSREESRGRLGASVFTRIWRTWSFGLLIGGVYWLLAALAMFKVGSSSTIGSAVDELSEMSFFRSWWTVAERTVGSQTVWLAMGAILAGTIVIARTGRPIVRTPRQRRFSALMDGVVGMLHAAAVALMVVTVVATSAGIAGIGDGAAGMYRAAALVVAGVAVFAVGYTFKRRVVGLVALMSLLALVAASLVVVAAFQTNDPNVRLGIYRMVMPPLAFVAATCTFAAYLFLANLRGRNANELSVALRHEGWKNFVRFHINDRGDLDVYAFGIHSVPEQRPRFVPGSEAGKLRLELSGDPVDVELIDRFTVRRTDRRPEAGQQPPQT